MWAGQRLAAAVGNQPRPHPVVVSDIGHIEVQQPQVRVQRQQVVSNPQQRQQRTVAGDSGIDHFNTSSRSLLEFHLQTMAKRLLQRHSSRQNPLVTQANHSQHIRRLGHNRLVSTQTQTVGPQRDCPLTHRNVQSNQPTQRLTRSPRRSHQLGIDTRRLEQPKPNLQHAHQRHQQHGGLEQSPSPAAKTPQQSRHHLQQSHVPSHLGVHPCRPPGHNLQTGQSRQDAGSYPPCPTATRRLPTASSLRLQS